MSKNVRLASTLIAITVFTLTSWKELNPALFEKKEVNSHIVLDWFKSEAQARKRDVSVNLTAMLRIPNYAIISHTKDSQQHRNWPLFHSVPADAVWIKQQHVCSRTALAVWRHRSSVLLSVSVVFVNWCFFLFCEYDHFFFCVIWVRKDSSSEGITWEVKSYSHTVVYPSLLFYVKYALCILTTIKGIETFSTCAIETCFIYPVNGNQFEYFASWRVRASSCTIDTYVCIFVVHG